MSAYWIQRMVGMATVAATLGAIFAPGVAEAQEPQESQYVSNISVLLDDVHHTDEDSYFAGIDECEDLAADNPEIAVTFEAVSGVNLANSSQFGGVFYYERERSENPINCWREDDAEINPDCTGRISGDDLDQDSATVVEARIDFETLTGVTTAEECNAGSLDNNYYVQLRLRAGTAGLEWERAEMRLVLDLIRPEPPTLTDTMATENSIYVEFEASESGDVENHAVIHSQESFEAGDLLEDIDTSRAPRSFGSEETGQVNADLVPGTTVFVGIMARDETGNYSVVSEPFETTVVETHDFWDFYHDAGGTEEGGYGCQAAGISGGPINYTWAFALALLAGLFWRNRRRLELAQASAQQIKEGRR